MLDRSWLVRVLIVAASGCASAISATGDSTDGDPDAGDTGGAGGSDGSGGADTNAGGAGPVGAGGGSVAGFPGSSGSSAGGKAGASAGGASSTGGKTSAGGGTTGPGGTSSAGGSTTGKGGSMAQGGSAGPGGGSSTGGTGATMCSMPIDSCPAAQGLGSVSGDSGGASVNGGASASAWFSVRVTEDDNGVLGTKLKVKIVLTSPATANYDLFAYVDNGNDQLSCSNPSAQSTNASGQDSVDLKWGEGSVANGSDDSRTVSIEVRWISGSCDAFTLKATGNN